MITERQREFQVLAEKLLYEVEQSTDELEARRVGSAADIAVTIAGLANSQGDVPADYFDAAYRLLSANSLRPDWAAVHSARSFKGLIRQHVNSAMDDRRAAQRAEQKALQQETEKQEVRAAAEFAAIKARAERPAWPVRLFLAKR